MPSGAVGAAEAKGRWRAMAREVPARVEADVWQARAVVGAGDANGGWQGGLGLKGAGSFGCNRTDDAPAAGLAPATGPLRRGPRLFHSPIGSSH